MAHEKIRMYMVRAGADGTLFEMFKNEKIVSMGFESHHDLSNLTDYDELKETIKRNHPNWSQGKVNITAGQLWRFTKDLKEEDYILTYNPISRIYLIGKVKSPYIYKKSEEYPHQRKVEWIKEISRDKFSTTLKNTLGAISTLFEITDSNLKEEIIRNIENKAPTEFTDAEEEIEILKEDMANRARELIKDKIMALDPYQMQDLVAGILRAKGYKTRISPRGPDRGKDIVASPDGLGLEEPRIVVEVKHRAGQVDRKEVAGFIGGLRKGVGLFVSTGGFTKEAKFEAERSETHITLVDIDYLVQLIIESYDNFDEDTKELIPLTKIYWPD